MTRLNQKGMSLITVLIVMAIVGLSISAILSYESQKNVASQRLRLSTAINTIKRKLVSTVFSQQAWSTTKSKNPTLQVTFTNTPLNPIPLDIYAPNTTTGSNNGPQLPTAYYLPSTDSTAGFDLNGLPCTGFGVVPAGSAPGTTGNDNCPLRYDITLKSHVVTGSSAVDTIHFQLSYKPGSAPLPLNTQHTDYSFDLIRTPDDLTAERSCNDINGIYDASTNSCSTQITKVTSPCPVTSSGPSTYSGPGIKANAVASNCDKVSMLTPTCPLANQAVVGFEPNGSPICGVVQ